MLPHITSIIKGWIRDADMYYKYANRVVRALFVRYLLKACKFLFKIESMVHPPSKTHNKAILIIVIGGLGDCLLFDPLFRRLKEQWPVSRIDVLTGSFEQMWALIPSVDNLIVFSPTKLKMPWAYVRLFRTIYRNCYDIVAEGIAFLPKRGIYSIFTSLVFEASGAKTKIGRHNTGKMGRVRPREMGFVGREEMQRKPEGKKRNPNPYLTHTLEIVPPGRRMAHESAYIFEPIGVKFHRHPDEPKLAIDPVNDVWAADQVLKKWPSGNGMLIGVTLETTRQIKTWPLGNYAEIIDRGIDEGLHFVLLGLDRQIAKTLSRRFPKTHILNLAGKTTLAQMIAMIRQCRVFVSGDTGPSHIAQACRVPTVVLFGPSNEKEFGPFDTSLHSLILPSEQLHCRPCVLGPCLRGRSCVQSIEPSDVYVAIKDKLESFTGETEQFKQQLRTMPLRILCSI